MIKFLQLVTMVLSAPPLSGCWKTKSSSNTKLIKEQIEREIIQYQRSTNPLPNFSISNSDYHPPQKGGFSFAPNPNQLEVGNQDKNKIARNSNKISNTEETVKSTDPNMPEEKKEYHIDRMYILEPISKHHNVFNAYAF